MLHYDCGQVALTDVPRSPFSIIWYLPKGADTLGSHASLKVLASFLS